MTGKMFEDKPRFAKKEGWVEQKPVKTSRICAISDMHGLHRSLKIPKCDILVVGGDITNRGEHVEIMDFNNWCFHLKNDGIVGEVVAIAGNHDLTAQRDPETWKTLLPDVVYLQDSECEVRGLRIYGSPWTPSFFKDNWVFNADRGKQIKAHWNKIPIDLDILITHGPAYGACDLTDRGERVGCQDLREEIIDRTPRLHVCGHIHHGAGMSILGNTTVMNASSCNERYKPVNSPLVIDL